MKRYYLVVVDNLDDVKDQEIRVGVDRYIGSRTKSHHAVIKVPSDIADSMLEALSLGKEEVK
jgi:hypothetical protein